MDRRPLSILAAAACVAAAGAPPAVASTNTLVTIGGTGTAGSSGDAGSALAATFNGPRGMVRTVDGSLLIADTGNHKIRKISPAGVVTTVAGTGTAGSGGDGGLATAATLNGPRDIELAPGGGYYIVDTGGNRIRKVDAGGTITTIVNTVGTSGSAGDSGPAGSAQLAGPSGLGVAANGDLYIADTANNKIRIVLAAPDKSVSSASLIYTIAGTGAAGGAGDGGPAVSATLSGPQDVLPMADGGYVIADTANSRIRRVDAYGTVQSPVWGGCGTPTFLCGDGMPIALGAGRVTTPAILIADGAGGYLIADTGDHRVRRVTAGGMLTTLVGSGVVCATATDRCGDGSAAEVAQLNSARGLALAPDGTLYLADSGTNRIRARVADANTAPVGPAGPQGPGGSPGAGGSQGPTGATGPQGATGPDGSGGGAGAEGAIGTTGASGDPGRDGDPGEPGAAGAPGRAATFAIPFVVVLPSDRVRVKGGRATTLPLFVSRPCRLTIRLTAAKRRHRTVTVLVTTAGRVRVNLGRVATGRYRLVLSARYGNVRAEDNTTLIVG